MTEIATRLFRTLARRAQRLFDIQRSGHREKLLAYRNLHKGRRAFVIGNGPSVRLEDLERLSGELTFCCNRFHLAYPLINFRPSHTLIADSHMLQTFGAEIATDCAGDLMVGAAYLPRHLEQDFTWIRLCNRNPFRFSADITRPIAPGGSVLVLALQVAFYMGIREVYLYGIDHDFTFNKVPGEPKLVSGEENHFISDYRAGDPWYPPEIKEIEEALVSCRQFYEAHGGRVLNATRGGKLNQIERADFDQIALPSAETAPGTAGSANLAGPEQR